MKKRKGRKAPASPDAAARDPGPVCWLRIEAFLERFGPWLSVALALIATARIVSTYPVFGYSYDEPAHLAAGMEWLDKHTYTYEHMHPPLARVMTAILPWLAGAHSTGGRGMWNEGFAILTSQGGIDRMLALSRAGILPFFWLLCWVAYASARWITGGRAAAVFAVFLATMTPALLAHGGLATTDMGLAATLMLAVYTGWRWVAEPTMPRACAFGASAALAFLSKFSTLVFLPSVAAIGLLIWWIVERPPVATVWQLVKVRAVPLLIAACAAFVLVWAMYRFSIGASVSLPFVIPVPAPEVFSGIKQVMAHNANGHLTYLRGAVGTVGWPSYWVIALLVKTPLAILALGMAGLVLLLSGRGFGPRGWLAPAAVLGILLYASFLSQIMIGTRHILPVFVALAVAGACAVAWALPRLEGRNAATAAVALLLVSAAGSSAWAHPDYLAYFNVIAGDRPEQWLVDSDLDWGQDVKRLGQRLKELGATDVSFLQYAPGDLEKLYGFPPISPLDVDRPKPGWNAVSLTPLKLGLFGDTRYLLDPVQLWPDRLPPTERIGRGILLYYVPSK